MALWVCVGCTTVYAVGIERCPHCGGTEYEEEGMAKITRHGGATNQAADVEEQEHPGTGVPMEGVPAEPDGSETVLTSEAGENDDGEGVASSPGNSSSTSSEKPETKPKQSGAESPKRARTTGSRSGTARTGSSSAPSTDGDPTEPSSAKSSDEE